MKLNLRLPILAGAGLLAFLSSCNIFDPLDSPGGDRQLLSAARACFDKGDFACAREYYGKLGGNQDAIAELAFLSLDEEGMDISAIVRALAISDGETIGSILTELGEALTYKTTPGEAKRQRLVDSYKTVANITNTSLKGFVRFTTAIAIAAEIVAEESSVASDNVLSKTDLVLNAATCTEVAACTGAAAACVSTSNTIAGGAEPASTMISDPSTATLAGATPTWGMFVFAMRAALEGIEEMGVQTGDSLTLINQILNTATFATDNDCARAVLVKNLGVGRN